MVCVMTLIGGIYLQPCLFSHLVPVGRGRDCQINFMNGRSVAIQGKTCKEVMAAVSGGDDE